MPQSKYFPNLRNGVDNADVEQVEQAFSDIETDVNNILNTKADKTETYTKTEVDDKDNAIKSDIEALKQKSIPHTTASDYPLTVTDHLEGEEVINYQVYGNSTQATRSGKNILPYPYNDTTKTMSGITFTDNGDGTITVNGTSTGDAIFTLCTANILDKSKKYFLSGNPNSSIIMQVVVFDTNNNGHSWDDNGNGVAIDLLNSGDWEISTTTIFIHVISGTTLSNVVIKPQIEGGTTATAYEQYGVSPSPDYPSEIMSVGDLVTDTTSEYYGKYDVPVIVHGKNLINESAITLSSGYWSDIDGHPINNNSRFIRISSVKCNPNEKYTLSSNLNIYSIWFFNNDTAISKITKENMVVAVNTPENCNRLRISLCNTSGNTDTVAFKWIQLELGSTATSYEPYTSETKHIYLDEPLRKVGNYADYVDFENQKVVRQVKEFTLTNTGVSFTKENDTYKSGFINNSNFRINTLGVIKKSAILCDKLPYIYNTHANLNSASIGFGGNDNFIYVCIAKEQSENIDTLLEGAKCYMPLVTSTEEPITVPELTAPNSDVMNVSSETATQPSQIDLTYYQDINKVLTNLTNAILAQGGNV